MAIPVGDKEKVYEMLKMLDGTVTDDFKSSVASGLRQFFDMVKEQEKIDQRFKISGDYNEYSPKDGANIIADAAEMQKSLELALSDPKAFLRSQASLSGTGALALAGGLALSKAAAKKEVDAALAQSFSGRSFPGNVVTTEQKARYAISQLKKVPELVTILDKAAADGWRVDDSVKNDQTVEETIKEPVKVPEGPALNLPEIATQELQGYYKDIGYTGDQAALGQDFWNANGRYINAQIAEAEKVVKFSEGQLDKALTKDMPDPPKANDPEWTTKAAAYIQEFMAAEEGISAAISKEIGNNPNYNPGVGQYLQQLNDTQSLLGRTVKNLEVSAKVNGSLHNLEVSLKEAAEKIDVVEEEVIIQQTEEEPALSDVEQASLDVETLLQDMVAPMILEKTGKALEFDGAPDGTFGKDSQIALQTFLIGADADSDFGDLGATPWLYDNEVAGKLSTNLKNYIKNNPAMLAKQLNDQAHKAAKEDGEAPKDIVKFDQGKILWAEDDQSGQGLYKAGDELTSDMKAALVGASVDSLIIQLNLLKEKEKLSTEQLVNMTDLMPPQMKFIGFLIGMIAPYLPPGWMEGINGFVKEMFGFDLMAIVPKNEETGKYAMGDTFGVTEDAKQNVDKLAELYKAALEKADGKPEALRTLVKDGIKAMYAGKAPEKEQEILAAADKAVNAAQEAVNEDGSVDAELAALQFSKTYHNETLDIIDPLPTVVEQSVDQKAEAPAFEVDADGNPVMHTQSGEVIFYNEVELFDREMARLDQIAEHAGDNRLAVLKQQTALFQSQISVLDEKIKASHDGSHNSQRELQAHGRPEIELGENGQINIFYVDDNVEDAIDRTRPHIESLERDEKEFKKTVYAYDKRIRDKTDYMNTGKIYDSEKARLAEEIKELKDKKADVCAPVKLERIQRNLAQARVKFKTFNRAQYKTVDATDDMKKLGEWTRDGKMGQLQNNSALVRKEFPTLAKILDSSPYTKRYGQLVNLGKSVSGVEQAMAQQSASQAWKQANKIDDRLEKLERKSEELAAEYKKMKDGGVDKDSPEFQKLKEKIENFGAQKDKIIGRVKLDNVVKSNAHLKRVEFSESKPNVDDEALQKHLQVPDVTVGYQSTHGQF